jgi:hypothetical protein
MEMLLAFIYNTLCKVEEKNNASKPKRWGVVVVVVVVVVGLII